MTGSRDFATHLRRAAAKAYVVCPDLLRPARGLAVGLALSTILWLALINATMLV